MPITNTATLNAALAQRQNVYFNKNGQTVIAALFYSMWRFSGNPDQPSPPTTAVICNDTTPGGLVYTQPSPGKVLYLADTDTFSANALFSLSLWDRLAHMGGLSGADTGVQTVGVDISGTGSNLAQRRGDYSEVMWSLQWYTGTGATPTTVTVNYTATDDTTGSVSVALSATVAVRRLIHIPRPANGKLIKSIQSIQLSPSTGTAGDFGVTASRLIAPIFQSNAGIRRLTPLQLGLPVIHPQSCLEFTLIAQTTGTGVVGTVLRLIQG